MLNDTKPEGINPYPSSKSSALRNFRKILDVLRNKKVKKIF